MREEAVICVRYGVGMARNEYDYSEEDEELAEVTQLMMDALNDLDVGALEYLKKVCDILITIKRLQK